ncbi:putative F-box protein [Cardamine amara subsp. amara]|uniref:F-box protein n=1 Tax=Cardamine amara subsp. amara TaxID=228776 RepID=A0ABD1B584_CARAN
MDQREEKREAIKRKRGKSSSSLSKSASSSLPVDLISEIFLKLPAKSILRFRSVSKLWSSITTNPYFTKSFESRPNLLFFFKKDDKFFAFKISQDNRNPSYELNSYSYSQPIDSYSITFPKGCTFTINTESVHGLICFQKSGSSVLVWNPSMRKLPLSLRKPDKTWKRITFFLGYDPAEGKHKVVCMPNDRASESDECRILTLGSDQESWRMVKTNHKHLSFPYPNGQCINGVLYYRGSIGSDHVIMSFDVRSEEFNVIKLPWKGYWNAMMMISYQGRLACIGSIDENSLLMWVLEDAEKHEWSRRNFLPLSHYDRHADKFFKLIGITNDGELIYVPKSVHEPFHVIYIDPIRQRFRKVHYRGILDADFRLRNGLGDKPVTGFQFFPNHIETLMPL